MTTIDNILALADEHAEQWDNGRENSHIAREALRTALTEALASQTVRDPATIRWPHRVEHISGLGYVVWRDVFEGVIRCSLRDAVLAHKVALFVSQDEAVDYANYRNTRTATLGTDAIDPLNHGIGGDK